MKKYNWILWVFATVSLIMGYEKCAHADVNNPTLGACIVQNSDGLTCKLSAHPTIVQPLSAIDLKTSTLMYGLQAVSPGLCYGVTYKPSEWYASGVAFCLNTSHTDAGNIVFPSGIVQLLKWAEVGVGSMCSDSNSSEKNQLICHVLLLFGVNIPIE